jgi:SAM-dependent methyltransferase
VTTVQLSPAATAFDRIADVFDERFTPWQSVSAQRRAVRSRLDAVFSRDATLIEIGGGTGEDALWLAERGRSVLLTDASPAMVARAGAKFGDRQGLRAEVAAAEDLCALASRGERFDGAFSNFAALNCVDNLEPVARGLSALVRPGGTAALVLFGTFCPGEWVIETLRARPRAALRRFRREPVPARLGGEDFNIRYFRTREVKQAMSPWFDFTASLGIGVCVPPSAAEPWISSRPRLLSRLERMDRVASRLVPFLGDHVMYLFTRRQDP